MSELGKLLKSLEDRGLPVPPMDEVLLMCDEEIKKRNRQNMKTFFDLNGSYDGLLSMRHEILDILTAEVFVGSTDTSEEQDKEQVQVQDLGKPEGAESVRFRNKKTRQKN